MGIIVRKLYSIRPLYRLCIDYTLPIKGGYLVKDKQINIRIPKSDIDLIKKYGGSYSEIWELGFNEYVKRIPEIVQTEMNRLHRLYIQYSEEAEAIKSQKDTESQKLIQLVEQYITPNELFTRSIDNPNITDKAWVKSRVKELKGITVDDFFDFAKNYILTVKENKNNKLTE